MAGAHLAHLANNASLPPFLLSHSRSAPCQPALAAQLGNLSRKTRLLSHLCRKCAVRPCCRLVGRASGRRGGESPRLRLLGVSVRLTPHAGPACRVQRCVPRPL
ncbi:unnamed protein product [Chondrus crispus]|uniref:Uncharacterized protein n=1 Tax=Chondrus crispus TaxID=2769 RepID=R7Q5Z2_CHOCR|nr:unnamed protein product [Chondrus crispus]CDF33937.1 unnamed protein product [Chondrus crispus]|eukprot:XP_005713756.1 unnamed protein product [Chondrus crispus]